MRIDQSSNFDLEKKFLKEGYDFVIGTDEAGRGPLAGPVVAAAVTLKNIEILNSKSEINSNFQNLNDQKTTNYKLPTSLAGRQTTNYWTLVRDSKKLSHDQREKVFDFIHENFYVGVGLCDQKTIDRINILEASFLAMKKAVVDLEKSLKRENKNENNICHSRKSGNPVYETKDRGLDSRLRGNDRKIVLVDGNKEIPNFSMEQKAIIGGDKIVKSISAASIVAKVTRDRIMLEMHEKYPQYQFDKHKGYGTKLHMDALQKYGPCEIHRQSFAPVKSLLKKY